MMNDDVRFSGPWRLPEDDPNDRAIDSAYRQESAKCAPRRGISQEDIEQIAGIAGALYEALEDANFSKGATFKLTEAAMPSIIQAVLR